MRETASARLVVNGLPVDAIRAEPGRAVFTFDDLCRRPLGTREYLELARRFARIELIGVPDLSRADREAAQRFADLVDVLHDGAVPTRITSAAGPERLLDAAFVPRDAARTVSRLSLLPALSPPADRPPAEWSLLPVRPSVDL
ncbi:AFG1/ZapE family ATPase [Agromyces archimandritae]|uniref:Cell division protein ZapE n=1 Tax=Agromyces archimandritae TaxID=2781962 RepID=A0A975FPR3_9MICO|nr:AFG1/ZapE family ATPase [Agromyces archimandritae]QTX05772.1 cell division protein ZapE [Agromyces archimandritae]